MPSPLPRARLIAAAGLFAVLVLAANHSSAQPAPPKKVLTHADQDIWRTTASAVLSDDGRFVAWYELPGEGDGEFVVKSVENATTWRQPTKMRAATVGFAAGVPAKTWCAFNPAGTKAAYLIEATKTDKDDKTGQVKRVQEATLGVIDLASGKTEPFGAVRAFEFTPAGSLVYLKNAPPAPKAEEPKTKLPFPVPGKGAATPPAKSFGSDLVIRDLAAGTERVIPDVDSYTLAKDGKLLVYAVASRAEDHNGVFAVGPGDPTQTIAIKTGAGRYSRLTWDDSQALLAFLHDTAGVLKPGELPPPRPAGIPLGTALTPAPRPQFHAYVWERNTKPAGGIRVAAPPVGFGGVVNAAVAGATRTDSPARAVASPGTRGLRPGWAVADAALKFSDDGDKLFLNAAPVRPPAPPAVPDSPDKVNLDIWHYKDARIQPMQKVEAAADRTKSYAAVCLLDTGEFRQLSDETITVTPPPAGDWAVASDDRPYRHMTGYVMPVPADYSVLNVRTGERKPMLTAFNGQHVASPDGNHLLTFDGKDWTATSIPDGKRVNLTAKLPVKFFDEDDDHPAAPPPYAAPLWTTDGEHVILADRFDLWKVPLDGRHAVNFTQIGRERQIRLRIVELRQDEGRIRKGITLDEVRVFRAENLRTHETGFYERRPGNEPRACFMSACHWSVPIPAKNGSRMLLTRQSFTEFGDFYSCDHSFERMGRISNVNPKVRDYNWGRAELVRYKSSEGQPLSGILVKPENFDPAKKYPMVVYIYERLSDGLHTFRIPSVTRGQVINPTFYASNGYLVLMPDIAYQTGSPGQSAIKCVLPAIQAVVDQGFVDEKAIGINGQSWGGYQIAYMVTQTNRFKAAVAGAPVANMISAYDGIRWGTGLPRQFQYELSQSRIGETPWKAPLRYVENSPVFMADRVQTPLLMIHNDQDDAVPWYQGIEYFLALRRLDKECYLLNYNGEPHNLARKANARDFAARMFQFFEHHLKGKPAPDWMTKGVPFLDRDAEKEEFKKLLAPAKP